jgi:hypothetical protein
MRQKLNVISVGDKACNAREHMIDKSVYCEDGLAQFDSAFLLRGYWNDEIT